MIDIDYYPNEQSFSAGIGQLTLTMTKKIENLCLYITEKKINIHTVYSFTYKKQKDDQKFYFYIDGLYYVSFLRHQLKANFVKSGGF